MSFSWPNLIKNYPLENDQFRSSRFEFFISKLSFIQASNGFIYDHASPTACQFVTTFYFGFMVNEYFAIDSKVHVGISLLLWQIQRKSNLIFSSTFFIWISTSTWWKHLNDFQIELWEGNCLIRTEIVRICTVYLRMRAVALIYWWH